MKVKLALVQMAMSTNLKENIDKATDFIEQAAQKNKANIILLPELFENHYFCQTQRDRYFALAHRVENHPFLSHFQSLAAKWGVVLPVSFFEKAGQAYFNSLMMIDADGKALGVYRKSHIPDGPGYQEKYYFNPGDTGFQTWQTKFGGIGAGICWDQWFPESARAMALAGADLLLYPTAIGSEPEEAHALDTSALWKRAMLGHAVCNSCYLAASNRVGKEGEQTFYGNSFISDYKGETLESASTKEEKIIVAELDFKEAQKFRAGMGFFRDRRPDLYKGLAKF
ncbi:MAG: N-carbamoylputrescine amidase [Silvanigrellaceae bacterium]|nr:N-carbamoylputrescine amidase [Silvanigrellaceae bacterium]